MRHLSRILLLALLALPCLSTGAAAQEPEARAELERFRDSLDAQSDSLVLLRMERAMIEQARTDRANTMLHLRLGFVALRLGELGGKSHFDDAASEFQWAIDLRPDWPYPWYGMGLAEFGVGDSKVSPVAGLQAMVGKDALSRSAAAFARSAEVDPGFVRGLVELGNTALAQKVNIKLDVALDALRRAAATPAGTDPSVLMVRGRVEREAGDVDSALAAFREYMAKAPDRAMGMYELARTRLMRGDIAGQVAYYQGSTSDDSAVVAAYRKDIALVAPDSVLARFDAASGDARAIFLMNFWSKRDQQDLRPDGTRLAEHFRRFFYARQHFALVSTKRHYGIIERYRSGSKDFDDRGTIYIRHGEPTARASHSAPDLDPNESWRYSRPDGDLVFHFIAQEDVQDYKLVESLFDLLGFDRAVMLGARGEVSFNSTAAALMTSRERLSPMYSRLMTSGEVSAERFRNEERRVGRRSIEIGTTTDSYTLTFNRELGVRTDVLAVGRRNGQPLVQLTYAIEGEDLRPVRVPRGLLYSVRVRFVAMDSLGRVVASLDTTRGYISSTPVPAREHLLGRIDIPTVPGKLTYRLSVEQAADAGYVTPTDTVEVAPVEGTGPTLSDIALGTEQGSVAWARPESGDTVYFSPLRRFHRGDVVLVYYETGGMTPGTPYTTEVAVRRGKTRGGFLSRLFGGGGTAVKFEFEEQVGIMAGTERAVSTERLSPGSYRMEVKITDAEGNEAVRSTPFEIVGR